MCIINEVLIYGNSFSISYEKYGIRHVVISVLTRHTPLAYSLENDEYFKV